MDSEVGVGVSCLPCLRDTTALTNLGRETEEVG